MASIHDRIAIAWVLSFYSLVAVAAVAPGERPDDYSHAIPVSVSGKQAVVQLPVPRGVYLAAHSPDLRDLRLFDAAGVPIPFALIEQPQQAAGAPELSHLAVRRPAFGSARPVQA